MDVQINFWGVLLAAISSMVIGSVWYAKNLPIGKKWMELTKGNAKVKNRSLTTSLIIAFTMSLLLAYVLAHVSYLSYKFFGGSFTKDCLTTALWLWLGIALSRTLTHDSFEMRPFKLTALNTGNMLVTMLVMGLIIGWVGF
jgi:hypothetical protein